MKKSKPEMNPMKLLPTGNCFEDCIIEFMRRVRETRALINDDGFKLVHGICGASEDVPEHSHSWIEEGEFVWFSGILNGEFGFAQANREDFYKEFRVLECTKYTFQDLVKLAQSHPDEPPPWEEKYRRLCKDYKNKI